MKKPIDILMDKVDWKPTGRRENVIFGSGLPYATYEGILKIGEFEFRVAELNTGQRVILAEDIHRVFKDFWE